MNVLVGCEESQEITKAFRKRGHEAYSCDLQDCSGGHPEWHLKMSVFKAIRLRKWDLGIFHPDCTFMANSGSRWLWLAGKEKNPQRWAELEVAIKFFNGVKDAAIAAGIKKIALENPIPHKYAADGFDSLPGIGRPDQIIQPWQFGDGQKKATGLWLINLPKLVWCAEDNLFETKTAVEERGETIWRMAPGPDRKKLRSKTFPGIAEAMAEQWGRLINEKKIA